MNYINQIILGDCNIILKEMSNNSIDLIATDPPYGYSFMGKDWDNFKATRVTKSQVITNLGAGMKRMTQRENINYQLWVTEWAKECLRVLKDGAFMFYCMAPRQDLLSRALIGLENAGFDVGFTSIYHTYSSGFPKAMNIGLAIDKRECKRLLREKLNREPTSNEFEEEWKNFRIKIANNSNERPNSNPEDIKSLNVASIADKDAILFLWTPWNVLPQVLETIKSWGFKYSSCGFNWIKMNKNNNSLFMGLGKWTRNNSEIRLIGIKGHPYKYKKSSSVHEVIISKREEHSKKPDEARNRIVELMGDLPKVELFARETFLGWDSLGNAIDNQDIREILK